MFMLTLNGEVSTFYNVITIFESSAKLFLPYISFLQPSEGVHSGKSILKSQKRCGSPKKPPKLDESYQKCHANTFKSKKIDFGPLF